MTIYNDIVSNTEFPPLTQTCLHSYFQSELVFFYFNLYRGSKAFSDRLANVLQLLKKQLQTNFDEWLPYLKLYYRMIGHTRDYILGKGERELTYMMIWTWYQYFPTLAIYAVHRLVQCGRARESCEFIPGTSILTTTRTDDSYKTPFGSWRDIRSICQYVYDQGSLYTEHPLIDSCVELMNRQLKTDLEIWRYSYRTRSRDHISNIAKWIPRENKHYSWLNEKLAVQWTKTHFPCIFNTAIKADSYIYAVNKSKKIYRKTASMLNKALDTTEIKQCAKMLTEIDPRKVPVYTMMKQRDLVFGDIKPCDSSLTIIDRDKCANNFKRFFDTKYDYTPECHQRSMYRQDSEPILFAQMPVGYFIKEALRLLDNIGSDTETDYKIDLLNKQWVHMSNTIVRTGFDNILPMIDVSLHMQNDGAESYYTAIGLAILLAERSSFGKRILAVDNLPTWINLEEETLLVSMVSVINVATKSSRSTTAEFKNAFDIISSARISTSNKKNPLLQTHSTISSGNTEFNQTPPTISSGNTEFIAIGSSGILYFASTNPLTITCFDDILISILLDKS